MLASGQNHPQAPHTLPSRLKYLYPTTKCAGFIPPPALRPSSNFFKFDVLDHAGPDTYPCHVVRQRQQRRADYAARWWNGDERWHVGFVGAAALRGGAWDCTAARSGAVARRDAGCGRDRGGVRRCESESSPTQVTRLVTAGNARAVTGWAD